MKSGTGTIKKVLSGMLIMRSRIVPGFFVYGAGFLAIQPGDIGVALQRTGEFKHTEVQRWGLPIQESSWREAFGDPARQDMDVQHGDMDIAMDPFAQTR